jgi:hypothetical protein
MPKPKGSLHVEPYDPDGPAEWDELVAAAPMGTFLHSRRFLGYHGDRLEDASVVVRDGAGRVVAVLPAAVDPTDPERVASHPGATFGGLVHDGSVIGEAMIEALAAVCDHYRARGFRILAYAPVPSIYHRRPSDDDLYALFRCGAVRTRCDISSAVDLRVGARLSSRRRRGLAKAKREGVEVVEGDECIGELWPIVESNLAERHGARPVHTEAEIRALAERLPGVVAVVVARLASEPVAGVLVFDSPAVSHAQYIASTPAGNAAGALDAVFDHCLRRARDRGARYFDFGTSNRDGGRVLNAGLYEFKAQFGGGGIAYEFYELALSGTPNSS